MPHGQILEHRCLRPVLFINPNSGGGSAVRAAVPERARERGIEVVVLRPGQRLAELVDEAVARGADALGVAGGDGSLGVVATAAQAHGLPFVCVPAGTRNHFALDLGLDRRDPVRALDAFTDGTERRIDVGQVNGRIFLNNVSLGVYGDAVTSTGVPRCEAADAVGDRPRTARPERGGGRTARRRRSRPRPRGSRRRAGLEQPVCAGPPPRAGPGRARTAGGSGSSSSTPAPARRPPAEHGAPRDWEVQAAAPVHAGSRRRGRRAQPAARVRHSPGGAAGQDPAPRARRSPRACDDRSPSRLED